MPKPKGFFHQSQLKQGKAPISRVPKCGACGLYKLCKSPKMPVSGNGARKILIIGEAPGQNEDKQGLQFVGKTGQLLEQTLEEFDVNMREDCWLTNSLICWPHDRNKNRTPTPAEIDHCRANLINTVEALKPEMIIPLGGPAIKSLISWVWKEDPGTIGKWIGWQIPYQKLNTWICPNWHPSFVAREEDKFKRRGNDVAKLIWKKYFARMFELQGRPWEVVPDYEKLVHCIYDPEEAARAIDRWFVDSDRPAAFDYETTALKSEWEDSHILCCSISNGKRTISYPWVGEAVKATKRFIRSSTPKIASNMKFEDRWSLAKLGVRVRNWFWCTMTGAHVYDNRPEITGLKFQSFVWLGAESYDEHIKGLLRTKGNTRTNQAIKEIALKDLLLYCGTDSLLECLVARKQRKAMGYND